MSYRNFILSYLSLPSSSFTKIAGCLFKIKGGLFGLFLDTAWAVHQDWIWAEVTGGEAGKPAILAMPITGGVIGQVLPMVELALPIKHCWNSNLLSSGSNLKIFSTKLIPIP